MHEKQTTCRIMGAAVLALTVMGLAACAGMTQQEKNTAIGAGVGAIGGSILTGGSTAGTVGGAAVGGVIGHEVNKK
jgi:osmotically inducible lipoprotein OsmB